MRRRADHREEIPAPVLGHGVIEDVGQARAEDAVTHAGGLRGVVPPEGFLPILDRCAPPGAAPLDQAAAPGPALCIAAVAARGNLRAAVPRVKRVVGPFNLAV